MTTIEDITIRKVFDSRGDPTVEVEVATPMGLGICSAPSGASTGAHEVRSLPAGGIEAAILTFREKVAPELIGMDGLDQTLIDQKLHELDDTDDLSGIGGNVAFATSIAVAKAVASDMGIPLSSYLGGCFFPGMPLPLGNVIGGGRHAYGGTSIQEFLVFTEAPTIYQSIETNALMHKRVGERLREKVGTVGRGDEGAWVAPISDEEALSILKECCSDVEAEKNVRIGLGLDIAASEFFKDGIYEYRDVKRDRGDQIEFVKSIVKEYSLSYVEDPLEEEDFEGFAELTQSLIGGKGKGKRRDQIGGKGVSGVIICGDDLFTTDVKRLEKGVEMGSGNGIIIKVNQVGTLTDAFRTAELARRSGYSIVVSHRSGETPDDALAHIALGFRADFIKCGVVGGERVAKLNELIRMGEIFG
jgi:enolase